MPGVAGPIIRAILLPGALAMLVGCQSVAGLSAPPSRDSARRLTMGPPGRSALESSGMAPARLPATRGPHGAELERIGQLNTGVLTDYRRGLYAETLPRARSALADAERTLGPGHPQISFSALNLGRLLTALGEYGAAMPLLERARSIREQAFGPEHVEVADSLYELGRAQTEAGDFAAAREALAPIEEELARHPALVLIPNDLLLYLPIHALTRRAPDGTRKFLVETHVVSYLTQLELAELVAARRPIVERPLLAVANPDGSLPAAGQEVAALAAMRPAVTALAGAEATKGRFLGLSAQFTDLHLATHGTLDPERPERSYLLMAGEDEASRQLTIREIAGLTVSPDGMAVLSACETALGELQPGAALMTLAAAFSQAGSQPVIASLWSVNDQATRELMLAFHRALRARGRADALREAQVTLLRQPLTEHPFYWAPFVLIGAR